MDDIKLRSEIEELKREVINTRNLSIKTDNLIANLSHEIRAIEKTQEKILGKNLVTTIFIYLFVFTVIFGTSYMIFKEKVRHISEASQISALQFKKMEEESAKMKEKIDESVKKNEIINEISKLVTNGNYEPALLKINEIKELPEGKLIATLLDSRLNEFKKDISLDYILRGKKLVEGNKLEEGRDEFLKAKNSTTDKAHYGTILYFLGEVERKLTNYKSSNEYFLEFLNKYRNLEIADDAEFHVAKNYENLNDRESANNVYLKFHEKYPKSVYNKSIKEMLKKKEIKR